MLADLLFIFFNCKVTNPFMPRSRRKRLTLLLQIRLCAGERNCPIQEFNRRRQMWRTAESLDELKENVRINGFQSTVTLAIDTLSLPRRHLLLNVT